MWYECVSVQLRGNIKARVMMLQHRAVVSKSSPVPYQMGILLEFTSCGRARPWTWDTVVTSQQYEHRLYAPSEDV